MLMAPLESIPGMDEGYGFGVVLLLGPFYFAFWAAALVAIPLVIFGGAFLVNFLANRLVGRVIELVRRRRNSDQREIVPADAETGSP